MTKFPISPKRGSRHVFCLPGDQHNRWLMPPIPGAGVPAFGNRLLLPAKAFRFLCPTQPSSQHGDPPKKPAAWTPPGERVH